MFLVLTRKVGEKIDIGNNIQVVVSEIQGNQVRIGVMAPPEIPVFRSELPPDHRNTPRSVKEKLKQS